MHIVCDHALGQCQTRLPVLLVLNVVFAYLPCRSGCGKAVLHLKKTGPVLPLQFHLFPKLMTLTGSAC